MAVFGPGIVVMLADTDVGSVITAAQSGVQWGYKLLMLQFILMPILYVVQELTVRLGIFTGRGHGELIRDTFGRFWAWVSAGGLAVASVGAMLSELSGVAGVGDLYGVPREISLPMAAIALIAIVLTGSYRRVERAAIAVGLFELAFFAVAWAAHPSVSEMTTQALQIPIHNSEYLYLVAANIGAVIMPWMVFYQQSAIADKKLKPEHFNAARWDTAIGAVITQLIMGAVLVAAAATIAVASQADGTQPNLSTVGEVSDALTPLLGVTFGRAVFSAGVLGAGLVAGIVASLALAWGLGEVAGYERSLEMHPMRARWFYGSYIACVVGAALVVGFAPNLVSLNIAVQVMNALMLPLVLGFLFMLAVRALPEAVRLRGWYKYVVLVTMSVTAGLGVWGSISSLFD
jgi:Mn2+/Fe2+ NRAMP family transporter